MLAGTDTQTAQDHAQSARMIGAIAAARLDEKAQGAPATPAQGLAIEPPPDPDALSGPMPTFEVSPLEAAAARVMAAPEIPPEINLTQGASKAGLREGVGGQEGAKTAPVEIGAAPGEAAKPAAPAAHSEDRADPAAEGAGTRTRVVQDRPWPQVSQTSAPQMDVTR